MHIVFYYRISLFPIANVCLGVFNTHPINITQSVLCPIMHVTNTLKRLIK